MGLFFKIGAHLSISSMKKDDSKRLKKIKDVEHYQLIRDIKYLNDDDPMHLFNIYYPEGKKDSPYTIIDIHGGAWIYGSKDLNHHYPAYLASKGFNVCSISYRLIDKVEISDQILDCYNAIKFIIEHGKDYSLNTDNILLCGDSAGAHLALLAYALLDSEEVAKVYNVKTIKNHNIRMLTLLHPCADIHHVFSSYQDGKINKFLDRYMDKAFFKKYKKSPFYHYASLDDVINYVNYPFCLVVTSQKDELKGHAYKIVESFKKHGVEYEFIDVPLDDKLGHVFEVCYVDYEESKKINDYTLEQFLKRVKND